MTLQERAVATRAAVLRAAAVVFEAKGFSAASVADILHEAGVTKGAMYFHFASKEAVMTAIIAEQSRWRDSVPSQIAETDPLQAVIDLSYAFGDALMNDVMLRSSVRATVEQGTFGAQSTRPYAEWIETTSGLLARAAEKRQLREGVSPETAGYFLTASVTGVQLVSEAMSSRADLMARLHDLWDLVLPAIATPATRRRLDLDTDSRLSVLRSTPDTPDDGTSGLD